MKRLRDGTLFFVEGATLIMSWNNCAEEDLLEIPVRVDRASRARRMVPRQSPLRRTGVARYAVRVMPDPAVLQFLSREHHGIPKTSTPSSCRSPPEATAITIIA